MRDLKDDSLIEVWNNHGWGVSYVTDKMVRTWQMPGIVKKIPFGELYEALSYKGNRVLFTEGALLIKDGEVRERLGLPPLDEYTLDLDGIRQLLESGDIEKIEDFLQYCSNMTLDALVQVAIDIPVTDVKLTKLISNYAKVDLLSAIQEKMESSETSTKQETTAGKPRPKRIVKE